MTEINEDIQFEEIITRKQYQLIMVILSQNINYYQYFIDSRQQPFLHQLLLDQQIEIAEMLIKYMETHNQTDFLDQKNQIQQTPLMIACYYGQISIIRLLLLYGVDINAKDQNGFTPLLFAAKSNQNYIVIYLIYKGAEILVKDSNKCGLSHWAAFNNNLFILKILRYLFKTNLYEQDIKNKTPLQRAEEQYAYDSVQFLINSINKKIEYKTNNKLIKKWLQQKSKKINNNSCFEYLKFIFIIIINILIINQIIKYYYNDIKYLGLLFHQVFNILLNFIFFFIIENAQKSIENVEQKYQNQMNLKNYNSSLNFSQEPQDINHGCLEIDQTDVPLIQEENCNQSLNAFMDNIIDIDVCIFQIKEIIYQTYNLFIRQQQTCRILNKLNLFGMLINQINKNITLQTMQFLP